MAQLVSPTPTSTIIFNHAPNRGRKFEMVNTVSEFISYSWQLIFSGNIANKPISSSESDLISTALFAQTIFPGSISVLQVSSGL